MSAPRSPKLKLGQGACSAPDRTGDGDRRRFAAVRL